jgi:glyoxylase-like metal-dependent hydrolase (beta-lactamase superfamily II)
LRKTRSPIFTIEMLPARHGDALWIEYGDPDTPRRILIDGGPRSRATMDRLRELLDERSSATVSGEPDIELIVVTHIDADHISGILDLFKQRDVAFTPRDVWFNAGATCPRICWARSRGKSSARSSGGVGCRGTVTSAGGQ